MMTSTPSDLLCSAVATPVCTPLCQKPPSPITAIVRFCWIGADAGVRGERHAVAEDRVAEAERRERRERMAADVGGVVDLADVLLDELHRAEHGPLRDSPCRTSARAAAARRLAGSRAVRLAPARCAR